MSDEIWVGVGGCEAQRLPYAVLKYSIERHTQAPCHVELLGDSGIKIPTPAHKENQAFTAFSFQRFTIPQRRGYKGKAVSLDSDMLLFRDIQQLWDTPFHGADVLTVAGDREHFSVLLIDCEKTDWHIRRIVSRLNDREFTYRDLMFKMPIATWIPGINARWNCLDEYKEGETALLHYTRLGTQPWLSRDHQWGHLWVEELLRARDAGVVSRKDVYSAIDRGFVRPSLGPQVDARIADSRRLPTKMQKMDDRWLKYCHQVSFRIGPEGRAK